MLSFLLMCAVVARAPVGPNVVIIMTDDQGYGDFGFYGNPLVETPNLDAMARASARMTNFYVSPVCTPTRANLMTGHYNHRTRAIDTWKGRAMLDPDEVTIAEILRDAGYRTGIFGKWHLGDNYPVRAIDQGFEEALVHRSGGLAQSADHVDAPNRYTNPILWRNGRPVQTEGFCTDVYFDAALEWMAQQHERGEKFFAYIPTNAPHGPFHDVPLDLYEQYKEKNLSNEPFEGREGHALPDDVNEDQLARIFAMITNVDQNVGRLFETLDELGISDDTLVIFLNDNGPNTRRYVAGMRGMKSEVYEGGVRSPMWLHWPGRLEPGTESAYVTAHFDVLPTVLAACEIDVPEGLRLDGRSFWGVLTEEEAPWEDRNIVIKAHRGDEPQRYHNFLIRSQRWKLLHNSRFGRDRFDGDPKFELYDMENDPLEMRNIAADNPEIVNRLRRAYDDWFDDVGSTRPDNYGPVRIWTESPDGLPIALHTHEWRVDPENQSVGTWQLYVPRDGEVDIAVYFRDVVDGSTATITLNGEAHESRSIKNGWFQFEDIELKAGNLALRSFLKSGEAVQQAWQVEIRRQGPTAG